MQRKSKVTIVEDANYFTIKAEQQMYQTWFKEQYLDDTVTRKEIKHQQKTMLLKIIQNELPDSQRIYFMEYFYNGLRVIDIARKYGKHRSTISRALKRAAATVRRYAKYLSPELYKIVEEHPFSNIDFHQNRLGKLG